MTDLLEQRIHAVVSSTEAAPDVDAIVDRVLGRAARIRRARRVRTTGVAGAVAAVVVLPLLVAIDAADDPGSGSGSLEVASSTPSSGLDAPTDGGTTPSAATDTTASAATVTAVVEFGPSLEPDATLQFDIPPEAMVVGEPAFFRVAGTGEAVAVLTARDPRTDGPADCIIHALDPRAMLCRVDDGNPMSTFRSPGLLGQYVAADVVGVELVAPDGTIHRAGVVEGIVVFGLEPQPGPFVIRHIAADGHVVEEASLALFPEE
jgi:hypothetical protein